jgi:hypothetical protein
VVGVLGEQQHGEHCKVGRHHNGHDIAGWHHGSAEHEKVKQSKNRDELHVLCASHTQGND